MALSYTTITGTFEGPDSSALTGTAVFVPNVTTYAAGVPVLTAGVPITAAITAGQLVAEGGGAFQLLATDNAGLRFEGLTGFLIYTVTVTLSGVTQDPWSFSLPSSPSTVELFALANTGAGGGTVTSVSVASANGLAGTVATATTTPAITVETTVTGLLKGNGTAVSAASAGTDYLTPTGSGAGLSGITAAQVGADASGAAATAQANAEAYAAGLQPTSGSPLSTTVGGTGASEASLAALLAALLASGGGTLGAELAPKVAPLADASTVTVNAALGNDFRLTLTSVIGSTRAMGAPSNPTDGQKVTFELVQPASGGPCSVTWASGAAGYSFGSGTAPVLSTAAGDVDQVGFRYSATKGQWLCVGSAMGF